MKPKFRWCWLILFLFAFTEKIQANPASYLDFDPGARPSGMGSAFTGLADDSNSPLFNPAGLSNMNLNLFEANISVGFLTLNRLNNFFSLCQQLPPDSYLGFYVNHYGVYNLSGIDSNGLPISGLGDIELAFGGTYAYDFDYHLKGGLGASFIYQNLAKTSAKGFGGLDAGILYVPFVMYDLTLGASIQHLGGFLSWDTGFTQQLVPDLRVGISQKFFSQTIVLAYDAQWLMQSNVIIIHHFGGEIWPLKFVAFRGGLDNANPTAGISVRYLSYSLDYSYEVESNGLGDSQRITMGLFF